VITLIRHSEEERMTMDVKIPVYGSIARPASVEEGLKELVEGLLPWNKGDIEVEYSTDEFTSVCPTTGQPDFCTVKILYVPSDRYIESKRMKFYLWAFREYGIHCESLAHKIASDLYSAIAVKYIKVSVIQKARGGLMLTAVKELGKR
jgi:7-cyano-7-deazaguanine reductase